MNHKTWADVAYLLVEGTIFFVAITIGLTVITAVFGGMAWLGYKIVELFFMYPIGAIIFILCVVAAVYMENKQRAMRGDKDGM